VVYCDTDSVYCILDQRYQHIDSFTIPYTWGIKNEAKVRILDSWIAISAKMYAYDGYNDRGEPVCKTTGKGL